MLGRIKCTDDNDEELGGTVLFEVGCVCFGGRWIGCCHSQRVDFVAGRKR